MDANRVRILVVDDQSSVRQLMKAVLESDGHEVDTAADGEGAVEKLRSGYHDLVVMDIRMPGIDGVQALEQMKGVSPQTGVVMMTAYASVETAVRAMKLGAFDYITKPIDIDEVRRVIARFIEAAAAPEEGEEHVEPASDVVGASEALREVLSIAHRVAASDASVLIFGESGTGKEVIAREIVKASARARRPFVAVNCSAIPDGLLESELFGHERGAFTGAVRQKKGRFELAEGGTIFLDEIGDMSQALQAKLLRFLQDHTFQRVGGGGDITVDARVVAATNKDLEREVAEGRFRDDLFFRLNVVSITVPPLRDRLEDVPLLVEHFLRLLATDGAKPKKMSPRAMHLAMNHAWPGNVRELENAVQRAVVLSRGETIFPEHLPAKIQAVGGEEDGETREPGKTIREVERDIIVKTLKHSASHAGPSRTRSRNTGSTCRRGREVDVTFRAPARRSRSSRPRASPRSSFAVLTPARRSRSSRPPGVRAPHARACAFARRGAKILRSGIPRVGRTCPRGPSDDDARALAALDGPPQHTCAPSVARLVRNARAAFRLWHTGCSEKGTCARSGRLPTTANVGRSNPDDRRDGEKERESRERFTGLEGRWRP